MAQESADDIADLRKENERLKALTLTLNRRLVLLETRMGAAFHTAHGALLCIASADSRWAEYAQGSADAAANLALTAGE